MWLILLKQKAIIVIITLLITLGTLVYISFAKPVYHGKVLIEIGEIIFNSNENNDKPTIIQPIDNGNDLKEIVGATSNVSIRLAGGSSKLIWLVYDGTDPQNIRGILKEAVNIVYERSKQKTLFYQKANAKIAPTKTLSEITVETDDTGTHNALVLTVAFLIGLLMGIIIAIFWEMTVRKKDQYGYAGHI